MKSGLNNKDTEPSPVFGLEDDGSMSPQTVWYCRANCEIMDYSKVDVVYGYKDNDEIMASGDFVPLFKVMQEDVEVEIDNVEDKKLHEERYILEHAKKWCEENNIPYYISKDGPDHLGSKLTTEKTGDKRQGTVLCPYITSIPFS